MILPPRYSTASRTWEVGLIRREYANIERVKYLIVIEPTPTGFSAYPPDLPGCVSTGVTRDECEANMREAIEFHIDGLRQEGEPVPEPGTSAAFVDLG